jgi:acetyltransferase-like isoleucine patch superfamily enzyme
LNNDSSIIFPNVVLGKESNLGAFVVLGEPPRGKNAGDLPTLIGDKAIIRSHTIIYAGNHIGNNFQTGHCVTIRESNQIGNDVSIGTHTIIEHHVTLQDNVHIHSNAFIPEYSIIEDSSWVGPGVVFTNARYPTSSNAKETLIGPHLQKSVIIGAGVIILPGITIGEGALVGAGAVVVNDVPAGTVVVGNPARVIKQKKSIDEYNLG